MTASRPDDRWLAARRRLSSGIRWLRSPEDRARSRIIRDDFARARDEFRGIADGAPAGDPSRRAWIVSTFQTVWAAKIEGALSLALRTRDFRPRAVYTTSDAWTPRYHALFGLVDATHIGAAAAPPDAAALETAVRTQCRTVPELLALDYRRVAVGRIALSNYLNANKFSRFDLGDTRTVNAIVEDIRVCAAHVVAAERALTRERPSVVLMLEKGVSPMAELFGVCVREGIPVVQYAGAQKTDWYALKRYSASNATDHPFSLDETTWRAVQTMPWTGAQDREIVAELEQAYRGGTWFDRKFLHDGKRIKTASDVRQQLGLDPSRKTAVVFSHVLWDATFFYGTGLFDDYETWLLATVRAACANPRLNWVIKLHPDLVWKLKYEGYTGELRDVIAMRGAIGSLPDHVHLVLPDTDISTFSFFDVANYCLTVRGTIGIEMACHGVPVLTAGTGRYSGLGFTIESASASEYLNRLAALETLPPMSRGAIELARRYAYAVFHCRPWRLRSFETIKAPMQRTGHPLDHNLVAHVKTFDEIRQAVDLRAFAEWVDSEAVDYVRLPCETPVCAA